MRACMTSCCKQNQRTAPLRPVDAISLLLYGFGETSLETFCLHTMSVSASRELIATHMKLTCKTVLYSFHALDTCL